MTKLSKLKHEEILVTPALAEAWLKKNVSNRTLSEKGVRGYATSMRAGRWVHNGETIKFDLNGNLIDGQHRLHAVISTREPQPMLVVSGLSTDAFATIDSGKKRTAADTLHVQGLEEPNRLASALAVVSMYDRGIRTTVRSQVATHEIRELLERYPDLPDALTELGKVKVKVMPRSLFDGLFYVFRRSDRVLALEFMAALRDGRGVETLECWHNLRERLINNITVLNKMHEVKLAALTIKAWNYARNGSDTKKLMWSPDKEDFPRAD